MVRIQNPIYHYHSRNQIKSLPPFTRSPTHPFTHSPPPTFAFCGFPFYCRFSFPFLIAALRLEKPSWYKPCQSKWNRETGLSPAQDRFSRYRRSFKKEYRNVPLFHSLRFSLLTVHCIYRCCYHALLCCFPLLLLAVISDSKIQKHPLNQYNMKREK